MNWTEPSRTCHRHAVGVHRLFVSKAAAAIFLVGVAVIIAGCIVLFGTSHAALGGLIGMIGFFPTFVIAPRYDLRQRRRDLSNDQRPG